MNDTPSFTNGQFQFIAAGQFIGDPNADILWQNIGDQSLILFEQSGDAIVSTTTLPSLDDFDAILVGDFDGDSLQDVFLRNVFDHQILLSSTNVVTDTLNYVDQPTAALDVNGDGRDDVITVDSGNSFDIRLMDGGDRLGFTTFATGYAGGDEMFTAYDAEGRSSFSSLWFDISANQFEIARYTNGSRAVLDNFEVSAGKDFETNGDFDGDGNTDFLFRDNVGFGEGDIEIVFTNDSGLEENRLEYDEDLFFGINFVAGADFDNDGRFEALSADPVTGELSTFAVQGSDQFSREIVGGSGADLIDGREGNDSVYGLGGDDILLGDDGRDFLFTGAGNDRAAGGNQDDSLFGASGNDTLNGGSGNDWLTGDDGNDTLEAGNGTDFLQGGEGDDYLLGGAFGFDHLKGGNGNDLLRGGSDRGILEGNAGDDRMIGSSSNDVMFGGFGDDYIVGGLSQDTIFGGSGDDIIIGVDVAGTSGTDDTAYGGSGSDYFYLGNDDTNFYTGSGELHIEDFSTSVTSGDWLVLNGTASNYTYFDAGSTIEVRQSSDQNILAIIDTTASAAAVSAKAIYIG